MKQLRMKLFTVAAVAMWSVACSQTDAGITTAVKSKLAADDEVKAYQIDVDTKDKVVTLNGTVDTATAKTRATEIARMQKGVADVVDNINVTAAGPAPMNPDGTSMISDAAVTSAVKAKLLADSAVAGLKIDVDTREGVVTLKGDVRSQAEKDAAVEIARGTSGVRQVDDYLVITRKQ
jgi:hyperosmotically inducible periplasmic protein